MLAFLVLWLAVAVVTIVVMAHHGHGWFSWAVVATAFGPLAWPLAIRGLLAERTTVAQPAMEGDVLVAVALWTGSAEQILEALAELDPSPRSVSG